MVKQGKKEMCGEKRKDNGGRKEALDKGRRKEGREGTKHWGDKEGLRGGTRAREEKVWKGNEGLRKEGRSWREGRS